LRILGGVCLREGLILSSSLLFLLFAAFHAISSPCVFLLLDDLLKLFFSFWSSSYASYVLDSNSNFVLSVVNVLIKGEIEKPSGQYLDLIVMSH
jgi:hypothetical protein